MKSVTEVLAWAMRSQAEIWQKGLKEKPGKIFLKALLN